MAEASASAHYDERVTTLADRTQPRPLADRCPGLLRPHRAEDGALVRVRLPGGRTTSTVLAGLAAVSADLGEGSLQLTSRGNLQLRGVDEARLPELVQRVADLGLLPSVTHERVRSVIASPLSGLGAADPASPRVDVAALVADLDAALCATAELAELPGRFLFALDDGGGDVVGLGADLTFAATGPGRGVVLVGGRTDGFEVAAADAVGVLVGLAVAFLEVRATVTPRPWRIAELAAPGGLDPRIRRLEAPPPPGAAPPLGRVGEAASVAVPLSLLRPHQVAAVDRVARGGPVVVTPWRGLVVPGGADALATLTGAGLVADDASAWSQLTACIGAPGCARGRIDTQRTARLLVAALDAAPRRPVHLSGCERRCGAPAGDFVDLVAPGSVPDALAEIHAASRTAAAR